MKIYYMRHGQTVWNAKGIIQGRRQNRLSQLGVKQVEKSATTFKNEKIDLIFVSPLMRTMQTANIVNEVVMATIIKDQRLIEIEKGIFTARKKKSLTEEEKYLKANEPKKCGMESYEETRERVESFVKELIEKYYDKNILIVTHALNSQYIDEFFNKKDCASFDNAEIRKFEIN